MTEIIGLIHGEIDANGIIPFARFMELALYCPNLGYYEAGNRPLGRKGDYFTAVSVGSLFGEMLGWQFEQWLEEISAPSRQIVEAGAHDGRLAEDILRAMQKSTHAQPPLEYWIVEPSAHRREWQQTRLKPFAGQVRWCKSFSTLPPIQGVIFANELLDALPIHRLSWDATTRQWFEWGVTREHERLAWARLDRLTSAAEVELQAAGLRPPPELAAVLPDGFTMEICPAAAEWWRRAASSLHQGKLLTFDYGLIARKIFSPGRAGGTVRAYRQHHVTDDLLANPGEQDLTAHVNFTRIQMTGEQTGLRTEGLFSQADFLTQLVARMAQAGGPVKDWLPEHRRQFQTLTHPEYLGQAFQALLQSR